MNLSDLISQFIQEVMDDCDGVAELQRSEIASHFNCVPSQINYVISTRFSPEQGYIVESQRGGGGFIRISRVNLTRGEVIMHLVNAIGNEIDEQSSRHILQNLFNDNIISQDELNLMEAALISSAYSVVPPQIRNILRSKMFKNLLIKLS